MSSTAHVSFANFAAGSGRRNQKERLSKGLKKRSSCWHSFCIRQAGDPFCSGICSFTRQRFWLDLEISVLDRSKYQSITTPLNTFHDQLCYKPSKDGWKFVVIALWQVFQKRIKDHFSNAFKTLLNMYTFQDVVEHWDIDRNCFSNISRFTGQVDSLSACSPMQSANSRCGQS